MSASGWMRVNEHYGLRPPFNFRIAVPFLLNVCLLGAVVLICAFFLVRGELKFGTARFYFFLYLAVLPVAGAISSKSRKWSYVILIWCVIELGLGLGSNLVSDPDSDDGDSSLFPPNGPVDTSNTGPRGTIYHPLLQTVPKPNYRYTRRVDYGDQAAQARASGVDVASLQGRELTYVHNSLGLRGKEPTADDLTKPLIFAYGGSTTYDVGVSQGQTWVEHLQADLNNKFTILNWGVNGYATLENLLQTAIYQDVLGKKPVCATYYVGWNDIDDTLIARPDSGYADFDSLGMAVRRKHLFLAQFSPLLLLANSLAVRRFDSVPPFHEPPQLPLGPVRDQRLEAAFAQHIETIAAINKARGVKTIFIAQLYNRSWPPDDPLKFLPFLGGGERMISVEQLNSFMKDNAAALGARYIDVGKTNFDAKDFVDSVHFAPRGSKKFAALLAKQIGDYCQ